MEPDTFTYIWALLNPQGEYKRREQACRRLWLSYDQNKQRAIYNGMGGIYTRQSRLRGREDKTSI